MRFLPVLVLLVGACRSSLPVVDMVTETGTLRIEVYTDRAPVTAANFLRYVDDGRFDGATFYRSVRPDNQPDDSIRIEVIQGGLGFRGDAERLDPIPHETTNRTGVRHVDGAVSMARGAPGSASSEIFICIGNQPELDFGGMRNPDGQGFAAFGRVIRGMDVARNIQARETDGQMLRDPVRVLSVRRVH